MLEHSLVTACIAALCSHLDPTRPVQMLVTRVRHAHMHIIMSALPSTASHSTPACITGATLPCVLTSPSHDLVPPISRAHTMSALPSDTISHISSNLTSHTSSSNLTSHASDVTSPSTGVMSPVAHTHAVIQLQAHKQEMIEEDEDMPGE